MVNQMWLWVIDQRTIITAFTERIQTGEKSLFEFLSNSLEYLNEHFIPELGTSPRIPMVWPAKTLARELVSLSVNFLDRPNLAGFIDPVFSTFDNEIGGVSERVTKKYTEFRESLEDYEKSGYDNNDDLSKYINIMDESELLLDIRDVRDELSMVRNVFCQQRDVLEDMDTELSDGNAEIVEYQTIFNGPSCNPRVSKFLRRLKLIDENAENVEKAIQHLLDLKQKRANLNEARNTAESVLNTEKQLKLLANQAISTARQGKIILAFTVVTVFFTPLSWMSALFAVDLESGQKYKSWQVVVGEFTSLLFTAVIVWLAFILFDFNDRRNFVM
jgi:hypothetical protein